MRGHHGDHTKAPRPGARSSSTFKFLANGRKPVDHILGSDESSMAML